MGRHDPNHKHNLASIGSTQALKLHLAKLVQLGLDDLNEDSTCTLCLAGCFCRSESARQHVGQLQV